MNEDDHDLLMLLGSIGIERDRHGLSYYRRRTSGSEDLRNEDDLADPARRLWIERPRGALPLDSKTPPYLR